MERSGWGGEGWVGWTPQNAKKQQTVRGSSRQRPTREAKIRRSPAGGGGGGGKDAKNAWVQPLRLQGGGLGGGYLR